MTKKAFDKIASGLRDAIDMPPAQRDLLTRRFRRFDAPQPSELQVHIAIVAYVRVMAKPDVVFWHCPNGEFRDERTGAKLKAMGVIPGVPDLIFIRRAPWSLDCLPEVLFLEVKRAKGKQSDGQIGFQHRVMAAGCNHAVVRDLDGAIDVLERYGMVKLRHAAGRR